MLRCAALAPIADHFFTTRYFAFDSGSDEARWSELAGAVDAPTLVRLRQVHGRRVVVAGADLTARLEADAIVSKDDAHALAVQVADCVPVLIGDRRIRQVAAIHAGWRGTAAGIAGAAVEALRDLGSDPGDLIVAVGPSIGPCCYEVHWDLRRDFLEKGWSEAQVSEWFVARDGSPPMLDLWRANRDQLRLAGVPADQIFLSGLCTMTHADTFYSYRADGPGTGRLVAVIRARQS